MAMQFGVAAGVLACRRAVASRPADWKPPHETRREDGKEIFTAAPRAFPLKEKNKRN
jgi:hypothetical protein